MSTTNQLGIERVQACTR